MAKKSFQEVVSNPDMPVLVDFYADWCGPCKAMSPVVQQVASEFNGKVKVIKVNIDTNQAAASQYRVQGVPTFILFNKGQQVWRQSGAMPAQHLTKVIQQFV
ncbi:thioredoxin [Pontibacter akesuensis]|uniref:Thioredoxin n=1 Tax=Pontibacter akesuensis TaxID=388950 RepID=A0A1I7H0X1_9BACT|nr:thioredoxin [Pontibacter akesuensis]GHA54081.1 thiol reductase thioredoxin [Pontibacter akesuensis]SFU54339.1 thioredoxin [Pontibacter akesuensis]